MTTLLDRQKEYTRHLMAGFPDLELKGMPLVSACAWTGNASQENLVRPVTIGPKDHGSDGVLQWRLDRLDGPRGLKGWSAALGMDWKTLKTQAAFTLWELYNDPRYITLAKDLLEGKKKIETLTANICWIYERPNKAAAHLDKRISHAKSVYLIMSKELGVSLPAKIGAGAAVVVGGAAAGTNVAMGGDDLWTALAGVATLVVSGGIPLISKWLKSRSVAAPSPAPIEEVKDEVEIVTPLEITVSQTAGLDAAVAHRRAIEAELADAMAHEADERRKLSERLDAMRSAIAESERETAPKDAPAIPAPQKTPVDSGEYQGA